MKKKLKFGAIVVLAAVIGLSMTALSLAGCDNDSLPGNESGNGTPNVMYSWQGELSGPPANPQVNWIYYNTNDRTAYIWDGTAWRVLVRDGAAGTPGAPGSTPTVTAAIDSNGNLIINGEIIGRVTGAAGTVITMGDNGNWFIDGVDSGVAFSAEAGMLDSVLSIGANGNWFIDGNDTGRPAQGPAGMNGTNGTNGTLIEAKGTPPTWWLDGVDSGIFLTGAQGNPGTPGNISSILSIGDNGNWFIDGNDTFHAAGGGGGFTQTADGIAVHRDGAAIKSLFLDVGQTIVLEAVFDPVEIPASILWTSSSGNVVIRPYPAASRSMIAGNKVRVEITGIFPESYITVMATVGGNTIAETITVWQRHNWIWENHPSDSSLERKVCSICKFVASPLETRERYIPGTPGLLYRFDADKQGWIVTGRDLSRDASWNYNYTYTTIDIPHFHLGTATGYCHEGSGSAGGLFPVIGIDDNAFNDTYWTTTTVSIGRNVVSIGAGAFSWNYSISSVTFASGSQLETIGNAAFRGTALSSINLPASVKHIGNEAFQDITQLTNVWFASGSQLETIGDNAFSGTALSSINLPASVKHIGNEAFQDIANFSTVSFASGSQLETIGNYAFQQTNLTNITIPEGVTHIGDGAFLLTNLVNITIPEGITHIGFDTFHGISTLETVTIPASVTVIGNMAFFACFNLDTITILATTPPVVGGNTFENIPNLGNIYLRVPAESVSAYQSASTWMDFNVIAIDD
jgi:hypothetical protein